MIGLSAINLTRANFTATVGHDILAGKYQYLYIVCPFKFLILSGFSVSFF